MDLEPSFNRSARSPSSTSNATGTGQSELLTLAKSDVTDFVKYLLEGSGAEDKVDFAALRRDLEGSSAILSQSNLLDEISYSTSPATKKFYKESLDIPSSILDGPETSTRVFHHPTLHNQGSGLFDDAPSSAAVSAHRTSRNSASEQTMETQKRYSTTAPSDPSRSRPDRSNQEDRDSISAEQDRAQSPVAAALNAISERLASSSFPSLHPSLLFAPTTPYSKAGSLSERQIEALSNTIDTILDEYDRRGELVQTLLAKNAQSENKISSLEGQVHQLQSSTLSHQQHDDKVLDQLYSCQKELKDELQALRIELIQSQQTCQTYQTKCEDYKKKSESLKIESDRMQQALESLIEKNEKERLRMEETFQTVTQQYHRNPNKSGLDRLTLQVIQVYEEKMQELKNEMSELNDKMPELKDKMDLKFATQESSKPSSNDKEALSTLQDKTLTLETELMKLKHQLKEKEQELDIVKLQLLDTKVPEWIEKERNKARSRFRLREIKLLDGVLGTRQLIQQDRRMYTMKLYALEGLDIHECRDLIKFVCVKLDVKSVEHVTEALDDIEKVIRLIPQMQKFIIKVDQLVWGNRPSSPTRRELSQGPPHKLSDTLSKLSNTLEANRDVHQDHELAQSVRRLFHSDNNAVCLEKMEQLVAQERNTPHDAETAQAQLLMQSFCSLFDTLPTKSLHKVKQLYIQHASTQAGLEKLKQALQDEALDIQDPAQIIVKATECIERSRLEEAVQQAQKGSPARSIPSPRASQKWSLDDSIMQDNELATKKSNSTSPRRLTFQE